MTLQQPYLWVSVDSKGGVGRSDQQNSDIKSHCAQHYHQVNRQKIRIVPVDLAVPEVTATESSRSSPAGSISSGEERGAVIQPDRRTALRFSAEESNQESKGQTEHRIKKRKPQEWRRVRCHRFRKQSGGRAPKAEAFHIRQEVWQYLPEETDFGAGVGDPLTLCVELTAFFSRAAFLSNPRRTGTSVNNEQFAIQRALYSYKLSAIQMIRQRLSENPQSPDRNILLGIVTLARCEFMANNPEEGRLHLEAGLEIAHARGGLCTLSDPDLELMCLVEFEIAALSGKTPCTPLAEMEEAVYSRISEARPGHWAQSDLANLDCLRAAKASQTCKGLACLLQTTHSLKSLMSSKPVGQSHKNLVLRGLFAGFLLCCVQPRTPHASHTGDIDLDEPLRVAGLLVVAATCLQNTPKDHLLDRLTADLALRLQLISLPLYSPRPRTVASTMLWMYFVGAHGSSASQRQLFFLQGVALLARLLGLEKWKEVREQLKRFPYVDAEFDDPFEELWNSAVLLSSLTTT